MTMEVGHLQPSSKSRGASGTTPHSSSGPQVVVTVESCQQPMGIVGGGGGVSSVSSSAIVSLEVPTGSIDPNDFESHLDPQSIAVLEDVLQSDQGREMLTEALGGMGVVTVPDCDSPGGAARWGDHHVSSSGGIGGGLVTPMESPSSTTMTSASATLNTTVAQKPTPVHRGPGRPPGRPSSGGLTPRGPRSPAAATPPSASRKMSESENIRRSQRQQDRFEKQEAERIREENQQMLQREKEQMQAALHQQQQQTTQALSPSPVTVAGAATVTPQPTPTEIQQPVNVGIVSSSQMTIPVSSVPVIPVSTPTPLDRMIDSTSEASVERSDGGGSGRRPVRNRKLPAHLADPNYLSLEDATSAVKEATRRLSQQQDLNQEENLSAPGTPASGQTHPKPAPIEEVVDLCTEDEDDLQESRDAQEEHDEGEGTATEEDEDYTEDDPNRLWCICHQPHNNRFMICCDKCEDWFHGKCVSVTKAQGKAMELKNISWHCPNCKKALADQKKQSMMALKQQHRQDKAQVQQAQASPVTPSTGAARGRKSSSAGAPPPQQQQEQQKQQQQALQKQQLQQPQKQQLQQSQKQQLQQPQKQQLPQPQKQQLQQPKQQQQPPPQQKTSPKSTSKPQLGQQKATKLGVAAQAQKAEAQAAAAVAGDAEPPRKIAAAVRGRVGRRKSEKVDEAAEPPQAKEMGCVSCKKPARSGSVYCSDVCVQKYAQNVKNSSPVKVGSGNNVTTVDASPTSTTPTQDAKQSVTPPGATTPVSEQSPSQKSPGSAQSKLKVNII